MDTEIATGQAAHNAEHDHVWSVLPWFVNKSLEAPEHLLAASHVSACLVCRREVASLQMLQEALVSRTLEPRCEAALDRLHERLDEASDNTPTLFPWAAAAVLVIVTGLTALVAMNTGLVGSVAGDNGFITLGARTVAVDSEYVTTARIVFEQDITEWQMRELLLEADAELIDGPTPRGAYTIAMPNVSRGDEVREVVQRLRLSKSVIFVEPIVSIGSR